MPTKAQLESDIKDLNSQLLFLANQLSAKVEAANAECTKLKSDLQRAKNDSDRHEGNFRQADGKLKSISRVIASTLEVAYQTGTAEEYDSEKKADKPLVVRFLRHLFAMADTSLPF